MRLTALTSEYCIEVSVITSKGISYSWVGFDDFSFDAYCIKGLSKNKIALIKDHITKRAFYLSDLNRTQLKKVVFQKDSSTELSDVFINFGELPNENIETIYCYKDVDEGKIYVYDSQEKISNILNEKYPVDTLWEDMSDQQIETYLEEFSEGDCEIPFSTFD